METVNPLEFQPWPKIPRLNREVVITEKLDGTNAQILISETGNWGHPANVNYEASLPSKGGDGLVVMAGSRNRWLVPGKEDNYGFAAWVKANRSELVKLGPGRHFGEWWGAGIERRYGLNEKRFSLFNTNRWVPLVDSPGVFEIIKKDIDPNPLNDCTRPGPECCSVVPIIWRGDFSKFDIDNIVELLRSNGSFAAPGFMQPEGIVVWHTAAQQAFKVLLEGDDKPKGLAVPNLA